MIENKDLNPGLLTLKQLQTITQAHQKERRIISIGLLVVLIVAIQDFIEDWSFEQQPVLNILGDLVYVAVMLGLLAYLWRNTPLTLRKRNHLLEQTAVSNQISAENWRNRASELLSGLGKMIDQQMSEWELSSAEKQIALLLLKGYSLKEIAQLRQTKEVTVRQQAAQIYQKAGISGRAELSAFFLEDLLLPA